MSSLQQFLAPPLRTARSSRRPRAATSSPATVPASAPKANEERLEPRVEEREGGYFVLKEKYREGINPQEKVKIQKEPMKLVVEEGIRELAKTPFGEIEASKVGKDDIDVRLKWLGLFHRRKHHCKLWFNIDCFLLSFV